MVDYLVCIASERGDIEKGNSTQINYLRNLLLFFQSNPTPDQLQEWQSKHPFPARSGRLKMPDLREEHGKWVLEFRAEPHQELRFVNDGDAALRVWLANFPLDVFFPNPDLGPWQIDPQHTQKVTVVLMHVKIKQSVFPFRVEIGGQEGLAAEIRLPAQLSVTGGPPTYPDSYSGLRQEIEASPEFRAAFSDVHSDVRTNAWKKLYDMTSQILSQKYPGLDPTSRTLVNANVLAEFKSSKGATIALKKASEESPWLLKNPSWAYLDKIGKGAVTP